MSLYINEDNIIPFNLVIKRINRNLKKVMQLSI